MHATEPPVTQDAAGQRFVVRPRPAAVGQDGRDD